jgi:hypothetical protein
MKARSLDLRILPEVPRDEGTTLKGTQSSGHAVQVRRHVFGWAALALGLLVILAGTTHSVAVTSTALKVRHALDFRWAALLSIGISLVVAGLVLAGSAWKVTRGSDTGFWVAGAASAFLAIQMGLLAAPLGSWVGAVAYSALLAGWVLAWRWPGSASENPLP